LERPEQSHVASGFAHKERQPRASPAAEKHPAAPVVRKARAVRPRHRRPLKPGETARAKRIGEEADHPSRKLGEEVHGVLAPEGDRPGWGECEDAPRLAAPPAEVVDVMDTGVDEDAAPARPGVEPPAGVTPIAARDQVELAELAEMASGDEAPDVAEGRHEVEVLGDHQDPARGAG